MQTISSSALESPRVEQIPLADVQVILRVFARLEQQVDRAYVEGRSADHAKLNRIIGGLMYLITGRSCCGEL